MAQSPAMVDLGLLVLLMSIFGWKIVVAYVLLGLVIAVAGGTLIEKLHLERYVEDFIRGGNSLDLPQEKLHFKDRMKFDWEQVMETAKKNEIRNTVSIILMWKFEIFIKNSQRCVRLDYTVLSTLIESANGSSHYKILQILILARYCEMKKVRKLSCIVISVFLLMLLAACGNTARLPDKAEDVSEPEAQSGNPHAKADNSKSHENGERQNHDGLNGGMGDKMQAGNGGGRGGNAGGMTNENDPEIQEVLDANADKFEQFTFEDAETGMVLEYSLYIPENYDSSGQYPLIMFIPDATGSGKSARQLVEQYYGAAVWVTEEEQQKHPSFVVVPAFTETVVDDNWNVSAQVETAVRLISSLQSTYSIDPDRIYTTGQSMGCMTSLYLNSKYPDLFAASMYVSGQWDVSVLKEMENQKFFYITAGGDTKASGGQDDVMAMFDSDGVSYSYGMWSAQDSEEEQAEAVGELVSLGFNANMVRFETGTVIKEGESGTEHMASFNYGYRLAAVRDWLFEQTK